MGFLTLCLSLATAHLTTGAPSMQENILLPTQQDSSQEKIQSATLSPPSRPFSPIFSGVDTSSGTQSTTSLNTPFLSSPSSFTPHLSTSTVPESALSIDCLDKFNLHYQRLQELGILSLESKCSSYTSAQIEDALRLGTIAESIQVVRKVPVNRPLAAPEDQPGLQTTQGYLSLPQTIKDDINGPSSALSDMSDLREAQTIVTSSELRLVQPSLKHSGGGAQFTVTDGQQPVSSKPKSHCTNALLNCCSSDSGSFIHQRCFEVNKCIGVVLLYKDPCKFYKFVTRGELNVGSLNKL